ncbi:uncharacterized protein BJ171DRAFT_567533 [Polychytrium aggregatum]|uniref:uncharacterized protein n=1 Tax=Polychytrium aggregatum TaxID=110093 RepID=UPI0022FE7FB3|nr:uncharacterized protein BJ171DRAFT_567533 [Polychytrium aggregatum]KAI9205354.1 hypothetical protein BJ171DRAFT_567533 [Polychytrium aggregatum]
MPAPKLTLLARSALAKPLSSYDALLVFFSKPSALHASATLADAPQVVDSIKAHLQIDPSAKSSASLLHAPSAPGARVMLVPAGSVGGDVDDVRKYAEAARRAVAKCADAGIRKPLVAFADAPTGKSHVLRDFKHFFEVTLLGLLQQSYIPLQAREHFTATSGHDGEILEEIGILPPEGEQYESAEMLKRVQAIDLGRRVAKDITGGDPERMAPFKCAEYIEEAFKGTRVKVSVHKEHDYLAKNFPLLFAVARASLQVPRHHPVVVRLEYQADKAEENLFLVGKGVTFDTGGADVKFDGVMRGMRNDKGGAAGCAGFMKTVAELNPSHCNVVAYLGFVRNSIGADSYVCDEIIKSRAGVRVLIGNTDAEGRMVMADLLALAKESALASPLPSKLFTVATLTGHVIRAYGSYAATLDNGPAREDGVSQSIQRGGHLFGDPFEISTLRREDYSFGAAGAPTEEVVQANSKASSMTARGHQVPMAFMSVASGISTHGLDSDQPISYTHLDIAGSAEEDGVGLSLPPPTGSPVARIMAAMISQAASTRAPFYTEDEIDEGHVGGSASTPRDSAVRFPAEAGSKPANAARPIRGASPGRIGYSNDLEKQLATGMELITDAFERKNTQLMAEINQWKQVSSNQRQQSTLNGLAPDRPAANDAGSRTASSRLSVANNRPAIAEQIIGLEGEISGLNHKVVELERALAAATAEKNAVLASRASIVERYNALKKSAAQLESFRKSIVSMVECGPPTTVAAVSELDRSFVEAADISADLSMSYFRESSALNGSPRQRAGFPGDASLNSRSFEYAPSVTLLEEPEAPLIAQNTSILGQMHAPTHRDSEHQLMNISPQARLRQSVGSDRGAMTQLPPAQRGNDPARPLDGILKRPQGEGGSAKERSKGTVGFMSPSQTPPSNLRNIHQNFTSAPTLRAGSAPVPGPVANGGGRQSASSMANAALGGGGAEDPSLGGDARITKTTTVIDAPTLYKQIRDSLEPKEFEEFADNISRFNNSQQTAEQTVGNISRIVTDRVLCSQMKQLIYTALAESIGQQSVRVAAAVQGQSRSIESR